MMTPVIPVKLEGENSIWTQYRACLVYNTMFLGLPFLHLSVVWLMRPVAYHHNSDPCGCEVLRSSYFESWVPGHLYKNSARTKLRPPSNVESHYVSNLSCRENSLIYQLRSIPLFMNFTWNIFTAFHYSNPFMRLNLQSGLLGNAVESILVA